MLVLIIIIIVIFIVLSPYYYYYYYCRCCFRESELNESILNLKVTENILKNLQEKYNVDIIIIVFIIHYFIVVVFVILKEKKETDDIEINKYKNLVSEYENQKVDLLGCCFCDSYCYYY